MKLRKIIPLFLLAMSFAAVMPVHASIIVPAAKSEKTVDQHSQELSNRLKEIRKMDKSNLTKEEKNALKDEKKALKKQKRRGNGLIFGLGILGVAVVVLLLIWII